MQVSIRILVENTTPTIGLVGEYGFSALIEADGSRFLFDTGSAGALIDNARFLKINLENIDTLVLSHGHMDHTGAISAVLELNPGLKVAGHPDMFGKRYIIRGNDRLMDVSSPVSMDEIEQSGAMFMPTPIFTALGPGIYASGPVPRLTDFEDTGGDFRMERNGVLQADSIEDDNALIIDHPEGLIIVSGCAHAGIINTIRHALACTGRSRILAFIGGTHLITASNDRISRTIEELRSIDFTMLAVAHCTGFAAAAALFAAFPGRVLKAETGMVFKY